MKRTVLTSFMIYLAVPLSLFAAGIEVPDLETRIRNSGGDVPSAALPDLPNPSPTPLPRQEAEVPGDSSLSAGMVEPSDDGAPELPETTDSSMNETGSGEGSVHGWASLGAGSPGTLAGDLSVTRTGGSLPDFALGFSYDAADGFGGTQTGTGFFDRSIALGFSAGRTATSSGWKASIDLSERTDGLQGMNAELYSLTSRDASWDASIRFPVSAVAKVSMEAGFSGAVFTAFADRPGTGLDGAASPDSAVSGMPIDETGGYRLDPRLSLTLERDSFAIGLAGSYGYETIVGTGERNSGRLEAFADVFIGHLTLGARSGAWFAPDSGPLGPFSLTAHWLDKTRILQNLTLSGGLDAYRSGTESLVASDPFSSRTLLGTTAADWFGRASTEIGLPVPETVASSAVLGLDAQFLDTAFSRGILAADTLEEPASGESAGLVPVIVRSRTSFATELSLSAFGSFWSVTPAWNAEWLDSGASDPGQNFSAALALFDPEAKRLWEIGARLGFAPADSELPRFDLSGTLRPARSFSLTLSFDDIVPLAAGKPRMRNAVYADRSGVLALTGRLDF